MKKLKAPKMNFKSAIAGGLPKNGPLPPTALKHLGPQKRKRY